MMESSLSIIASIITIVQSIANCIFIIKSEHAPLESFFWRSIGDPSVRRVYAIFINSLIVGGYWGSVFARRIEINNVLLTLLMFFLTVFLLSFCLAWSANNVEKAIFRSSLSSGICLGFTFLFYLYFSHGKLGLVSGLIILILIEFFGMIIGDLVGRLGFYSKESLSE